ncbi:MAG: cyclodeaminase/cyclohydrolase family protein [Acidobacteriota bacterium]
MPFSTLTVSALLDAFASPDPTPGGGTASAIAGAMGTSLLMMVAGLSKSRTNADAEKAALAESRRVLATLRARFERLADDDAAAFDAVMAAYRLPRGTDEEKAARKAAIARALKGATEVPLETCRAAADALVQARIVEAAGNPSAASDVTVAITLLRTAAAGGAENVRINLDGIGDEAYRAQVSGELERLLGVDE